MFEEQMVQLNGMLEKFEYSGGLKLTLTGNVTSGDDYTIMSQLTKRPVTVLIINREVVNRADIDPKNYICSELDSQYPNGFSQLEDPQQEMDLESPPDDGSAGDVGIIIMKEVKCETCDGSGEVYDEGGRYIGTCTDCDGEGVKKHPMCVECNGSGEIYYENTGSEPQPCKECEGRGYLLEEISEDEIDVPDDSPEPVPEEEISIVTD